MESDIHKTRSGKTIISEGSGGRSSRSGFTATVFGAAGFLGSHLVAKLARHGTITMVPYREEINKRHLKVTGDLGVVNFLEFDLRNIESIEESVKYSDIVFNLVGRDWETKNFSYYDVQVEGAKRIAEAVAKYNVDRFIHVSSHSADVNSPSKFLRSKALGEMIVKDIIPDATIVRPAPIFGDRDHFLKSLADKDTLFTANNGKQTVYPTYVSDVATALEIMAFDDSTAGKLYELNGPNKYTISQIMTLIRLATKRDIKEINLPKAPYQAVADLISKVLYWRTRTGDEIEREFIDQIVHPDALGYKDLGIKPQALGDEFLRLVRDYKIQGHYDDPLEAAAEKQKVIDYINATEK